MDMGLSMSQVVLTRATHSSRRRQSLEAPMRRVLRGRVTGILQVCKALALGAQRMVTAHPELHRGWRTLKVLLSMYH